MRNLVRGFAVASAMACLSLTVSACSTPPSLPWCSDTGERKDCDFVSYKQCMETVSGVGGYCYRNPGPIGREARRIRR
jgi:hypothetical protein